MKKKKYLQLYYKWMDRGIISSNGLCHYFGTCYGPAEWVAHDGFEDFQIMFPDNLKTETIRDNYWGAGNDVFVSRHCLFTPLRQNLVLLLACLNGEL